MPEVRVPFNGWLPRPHQSALWEHLQGGGKRAVAIWHRRAGKDEICLHHAACSAISRPGNYWHCLPEFLQGRKAIWTAVNANTGKRRIDEAFPPAIRETTNDNEMFIRFVNGSTWQIIGSDRYDATVGAGTAGITYSEWALANPSAWAYHRPMLEENNGWAAFITTPRGRNHALAMFNHASQNPNWFSERLTALDTRALSSNQLEEALAEYMALYGEDVGQAQFQQEYMCDWNAAILGAFYALEMARVRNEERIVAIEAIPDRPVHRAWDLGVTDDTSIWWFQAVGSQLFILDHLSTSGVGVEFYRDEIVKRANTYGWRHGMDYVPHDAKVKEWGSGRTRIETMRDLGLNPQPVPNVSIEDGRNAIRRTLPLCVFHPRTEESGISALEQHRREWDDEKKAFRANAVHDWTSHACLTGETLIATPDGAVPIREIRIGDMVSTPNGPARVTAGGPTKHADELIKIGLADGRALTGTLQHKVFTERGLISLAEIDQSDVVLSEKSALWCQTQSCSMAENTGFRDAIIAVTTGERAVRRTCTVRFGSLPTVLFRKVLTFITRTVAAPITNYPILSLSSIASTPGNIRWSALPAVKFPRSANSHTNGQPNGMPRRKDWHGTQGTAAPPGTSGNGIVAFARSAIASSCRRIQHAPSSVISIARWRPCDVGAESPLVYDLTVEKQHCYLANGILVSNSDAFRYLALSWRPAERRIPKEKPRLPDAWIIPPPTEPNRRGIVL